jgi:hypothetical protein
MVAPLSSMKSLMVWPFWPITAPHSLRETAIFTCRHSQDHTHSTLAEQVLSRDIARLNNGSFPPYTCQCAGRCCCNVIRTGQTCPSQNSSKAAAGCAHCRHTLFQQTHRLCQTPRHIKLLAKPFPPMRLLCVPCHPPPTQKRCSQPHIPCRTKQVIS